MFHNFASWSQVLLRLVHFQDMKTRLFVGISLRCEVYRHRGRVKTLWWQGDHREGFHSHGGYPQARWMVYFWQYFHGKIPTLKLDVWQISWQISWYPLDLNQHTVLFPPENSCGSWRILLIWDAGGSWHFPIHPMKFDTKVENSMQISVGWSPFPTMGDWKDILGTIECGCLILGDLWRWFGFGSRLRYHLLNHSTEFQLVDLKGPGLLLRTSLIYKWLFFQNHGDELQDQPSLVGVTNLKK